MSVSQTRIKFDLEQKNIPTVWHRLTSTANVGVSEPGRESKMGV